MGAGPNARDGGAPGLSPGGAQLVDEHDRAAVWLWGEHDLSTVAIVSNVLADALDVRDVDVVVDLRDVTFLDASILGALVGSRILLARHNRALTVRSPLPWARRVLTMGGLEAMIEAASAPASDDDATTALATWIDVPTAERADSPSAALDATAAPIPDDAPAEDAPANGTARSRRR